MGEKVYVIGNVGEFCPELADGLVNFVFGNPVKGLKPTDTVYMGDSAPKNLPVIKQVMVHNGISASVVQESSRKAVILHIKNH